MTTGILIDFEMDKKKVNTQTNKQTFVFILVEMKVAISCASSIRTTLVLTQAYSQQAILSTIHSCILGKESGERMFKMQITK